MPLAVSARQQYDVNQGIQNQAAGLGSQKSTDPGATARTRASFYVLLWLIEQSLSNLTTGLNTAGMSQTDAQNQINANVAAYNYGQILPWNQLGLFEGAITGTGNPGGTSSTSQPYFSEYWRQRRGGREHGGHRSDRYRGDLLMEQDGERAVGGGLSPAGTPFRLPAHMKLSAASMRKLHCLSAAARFSLACVHLLMPLRDRITIYHLDTGDLLPEITGVVDHIRGLWPRFVDVKTDAAGWIAVHGLPNRLVTGHLPRHRAGDERSQILGYHNASDCCFAKSDVATLRRKDQGRRQRAYHSWR